MSVRRIFENIGMDMCNRGECEGEKLVKVYSMNPSFSHISNEPLILSIVSLKG